MKNKLSTILLIIIFLIGLALLLYPTLSDYWNSFHQSRAIASYAENVAQLNEDEYAQIWADAETYNRSFWKTGNRFSLSDGERERYESLLNVAGNGVMGYIEIPAIECSLPIYHGTSDSVLQIAIGHIEGTSMPIGGRSSHSVLSGHRGLPSAKLFTDLDKLVEGDLFMLQILDQTLTYEVDSILIVDPYDVSSLAIEENADLCTLVTCTPYGINSHRLLVRGHRVENQAVAKTVRVTADAVQIEPLVVAPLVAVPILLVLLIILLVKPVRKNKE